MTSPRIAIRDAELSATITNRRPLRYADGPDRDLDRPDHVRSASGLAWVPGGLAIIQDDANFIAVYDPESGRSTPITLPEGEAGLRLFDDLRGNKGFKLDLESCLAIEHDGGCVLLAFGSGSTPRREQVVIVDRWETPSPRVRLMAAAVLYQGLRADSGFVGTRLNLEGVIRVESALRFFSRGNGPAEDGREPVSATCDIGLEEVLAAVATSSPAVLRPSRVVQYQLGSIGGVRLGFTDAATWRGAVLYAATAEISPDVTRDGPVTGSAIGVLDGDGSARWAPVTDASGTPLPVKLEGILPVRGQTGELYGVLDADDPAAASELCRITLAGPWTAVPG